jgi:rhamnosyltransferase
MNRIGLFCFYDKEGIVDGYVEFLLEELCRCLSNLVIIVNGKISVEGKLILERYAEKIYIRDNKGFDGGAYKDVLINMLGWKKIQEYDELVLCNDTFYGPFVSFESIFNEMENKPADFWGLSYCYNRVANYLQSYFLVFRKQVIKGNYMVEYFDKNINLSMSDISDIYGDFEVGLFYYLVNQGYSFASYSKSTSFDIYKSSNFCIKQFNVPILKKKSFSPQYIVWNNIMDTLKYLSLNANYDLDLILSNIRRVYDLKITRQEIETFDLDKADIQKKKYDVAKISDEDIKKLVLMNKKIYIYGLGIFSGRINSIINIFQGRVEGYIVSDNQYGMPNYKKGIRVHRVSEIINTDNMVVIVALNKEHTQEVASYLKKFKEVICLW